LVIGTDNLFSWPLGPFVRRAQRHRPAATVATWRVPRLEDASLYGVVQANRRGRMVRFEEKPVRPSSRAIALCVYYFPAPLQRRVAQFLSERRGQGWHG
jgi:glucose-1-phosphate adenylyltransferase